MTSETPEQKLAAVPGSGLGRFGTRSIRGRLQWWYGAVYAISILVFGGVVYWRADRETHQRAILQAVSTAQYLDVSLRNVRPDAMRPDGPRGQDGRMSDRGPDSFPPEFSLGPLPPEFQFRPPRESNETDPRAKSDGRAERSESSDSRLINDDRSPMNGDRSRPPRDRGPDFQRPQGDRNRRPEDRMPRGPQGPPPLNQPAIPRFADESWSDGRRSDEQDRTRPPVDRMQFVVWRPNRSVLSRSDGVPESKLTQPLIPPGPGPTPQLRRGDGGLEVLMRGPHETTILVLRPLEHDLANLYRFGYQISGVAAATLVVGLMGGWWISGRIVQPIQMISETAAQMSATNLDRRIQVNNLDQELVPLATVLNTTFGRLEQSFSRLTQFTADASHELRTPLAVIQSQAELALSQSRTSEYYQQALETCLRSADRMRSLVDGLLLLARTDSDRLELHRGPLDLRLIAEDAVMQLQEKAITAGVELECRTPEVPVMISADPVFLAQVPTNLIDNAIQHTPAGGKIIVDVRLDGTHAVLSVQDTGYGITPEHLPHLFERFYRVDIGRSRRHGGSGLGLAICRSLVEAHGGHIECKSVPGKGSTFTIRLALLNSVSTNIQGTHDA